MAGTVGIDPSEGRRTSLSRSASQMSQSPTRAAVRTHSPAVDSTDGASDRMPSFKHVKRASSLGVPTLRNSLGRWNDASSFSVRHRGMSGVDGWEHPARYLNASHMTVPSILPVVQTAPDSTPLPTLPYVVLCLLVFGEFSSAGVAGPFLFLMLNDFQVGDEGQIGFWAGILAAVFFFSQFMTSLLWASAAERFGRRLVLQVSLLGSAMSLLAFGTAPNLSLAMLFRFLQGMFNGAVGVAKGSIRDLTDETNESRAYAQMGFWWGMGGIIGPILGGLLEHPADKLPALFGHSVLFTRYPYLFPCILASLSTILGFVLSLFLEGDSDREGAVRLETDAPEGSLHLGESGYPNQSDWSMSSSFMGRGRTRNVDARRWFGSHRASTAHSVGSAYGYNVDRGASVRPSLTRDPSASSVGATPSVRSSMVGPTDIDPQMSMIERFVMANDDTVLGLADLWVAAAAPTDESAYEEAAPSELDLHDSDEELELDGYDSPLPLFSGLSNVSQRPSSTYMPPRHLARTLQHSRSQPPPSRPTSPPLGAAHATAPSASSPLMRLPLVIVAHCGLLTLHTAMFDQVFMSFLMTPTESGGLGLRASHFATLIAAMSLCQMVFQFHTYPSLGPPNGKLTHLKVLQYSMLIYLPCYVLFPFLRTFLRPSTDALVMVVMILMAALRWFANVLAFTAVTVLINAWTPVHLVSLSNGLAQTVSSFARCVGLIVGGLVWAQSIQGGAHGKPWPLNYHLGFWVVGLVAASGAIHVRRIREIQL